MESICIQGGVISLNDIYELLKKSYPNKTVTIKDPSSRDLISNQLDSEIFIYKYIPNETERSLRKKLELTEKKFKESDESSSKALLSIQSFHKQQQALYDEFVLLRHRYDDQKSSSVSILWTHCSKYHPDLRQIPRQEDSKSFIETEERIGDYIVGEFLGEGQFATVKTCSLIGSDKQYALKIISKERITTFTSLMRVSDEIDNLKQLKNIHIISLCNVIHTEKMFYIITEKGGRDLFDFFDEHPDGVPEDWAKQIISCVLKGVMFCHDHDICHRDLKPENILLEFDNKTGICRDLKLCDFGLSTKFKPNVLLNDFCGSPGFFAPEMIMHGSYYGDKADVWSIGCILLELVAGHEKFCDIWMTAYDYEILQNKDKFSISMTNTVEYLPDVLNFSSQLNSFLLEFLVLHSSRRKGLPGICNDPWVVDLLQDALSERARKLNFDTEPHLYISSPAQSSNNLNGYTSPFLERSTARVEQNILELAFNNISDRERKQMSDYIQNHKNDEEQMHLPPIIPATPNIINAKKILRKGNELANSNYTSSATTTSSSSSSPLNTKSFSPPGNNRIGMMILNSPLPGVKEGGYEGDRLESKGSEPRIQQLIASISDPKIDRNELNR